MGVVGLVLAPIGAVAGLLLLVRRLSGRVALGATMLVLAAAARLRRVPGELRFSSEFYTEAGGVVGSGVYSAIDWAGGSIGAALALAVLYALGLSHSRECPSAAISAVRSSRELRPPATTARRRSAGGASTST